MILLMLIVMIMKVLLCNYDERLMIISCFDLCEKYAYM